jgi:hypothetical protein
MKLFLSPINLQKKNYIQNTHWSLLTKSADSVKNEEALQSQGGNKHPTYNKTMEG